MNEKELREMMDKAEAMELLEKCATLLDGGIKIKHHKQGYWTVSKFEDLDPIWGRAKTLSLALHLLAKKLSAK